MSPSLKHTWYDRGAAVFFDWLAVPPGIATQPCYKLLAEPMNGAHPIWQTNMRMPNQLPAPHGFITSSLHCFYGRMTPQDRQSLRERYAMRFWIMEKIFYESPLLAIPDYGVTFPWSHKNRIEPDMPEQPGEFGDIPRYIPPLVQFGIDLIGEPFTLEATGTGLRFLPVLNGYLDRAIQ
jgi:hypothetical protein